jgi:hypothetical protein
MSLAQLPEFQLALLPLPLNFSWYELPYYTQTGLPPFLTIDFRRLFPHGNCCGTRAHSVPRVHGSTERSTHIHSIRNLVERNRTIGNTDHSRHRKQEEQSRIPPRGLIKLQLTAFSLGTSFRSLMPTHGICHIPSGLIRASLESPPSPIFTLQYFCLRRVSQTGPKSLARPITKPRKVFIFVGFCCGIGTELSNGMITV